VRRFSLAIVVALTVAGLALIATPSGAANQRVNAKVTRHKVAVGKRVFVYGQVAPKAPRQAIRLQRYYGKKWHAYKAGRLNNKSAYRLPISMKRPGKYKFRVAAARGVSAPFVVEATLTDPCNSFIAVQVAADGTFNEGAYPDPTTCDAVTGTSWDLLYSWPGRTDTSFTTVRIDGTDATIGEGTEVTAPHDVDAVTNQGVWQHGDIRVTQTLQLAQSTSGDVDTARIAYTVTNQGTASHDVGVRAMLDDEINYNDGAAFRVPALVPSRRSRRSPGVRFRSRSRSSSISPTTCTSPGRPSRAPMRQFPMC
jgi:hypothetical protein